MDPEIFFKLQVGDQQQYFSKTFFRIAKEENPKLHDWFWCAGFHTTNMPKGNFQGDVRMVAVTLSKDRPPLFDFPESGLYNKGNSSVYFQKTPARQSKKGLSAETAAFWFF